MLHETIPEARRQVEICNACRYCEGYCAVFPAITLKTSFEDGDVIQLANLCHNCRGCYYACQYSDPHEFAINLPAALADVRSDSWEAYAFPGLLARLFQRSGVALAGLLVISFALIIMIAKSGALTFYDAMSHDLMVAIFAPAFVLPLIALALGVRRFWRATNGGAVTLGKIKEAGKAAAAMKNLKGGHGEGCNFEDEDRFSQARRHFHQAAMWGFLMCFASTSSATVLHYGFDMPAPYGFFSLPKLFGVPGGVLLTLGAGGLAWLKTKADPALGASARWGGEMAFSLLLTFVGASGLALYAATGTDAVTPLLAAHLGGVLTLFLLAPYSKMAHGAYRFAALMNDAGTKRD